MSGWAPGDLALCVNDAPCERSGEPCPCKCGQVYTVAEVAIGSRGDVGLRFSGISFAKARLNAIYAGRFRKILPDKHEACEDEFVTLLQRIKAPANV